MPVAPRMISTSCLSAGHDAGTTAPRLGRDRPGVIRGDDHNRAFLRWFGPARRLRVRFMRLRSPRRAVGEAFHT